jgi:PAS domain S-box-containing protein
MMMPSEIEEPTTMEKEIQILHLEDDAKDAELIQAILDSAGISSQITCVQAASEFSEALSKRQYELILADYRLPAYDGISALRFSQENYPDIPFIFVSGTLGEDAAIDGLTQGATDYVLKNKLARLVPAVQRALSEAENRRKRKQTEAALRESEERLRQIASSLREVVWLRDVKTRQVLYVNPAFEELTGQTCESFYENRDIVIDAIHPDDKEGVIKALDQRFEGVPFDKEHRIIHPDGSVRWVSSRSFPVQNEAGEVYRFSSIMEDINERKRMEDTIRANEERLQLALDAAEMGQWEWNIKTGEIVWSQQCLALYGLPPDTPMSYERFLQALHSEDRERVDAALSRAVEEHSSYDEMKRTVWPDGTIHWTSSRGQVYCDAVGKPIRMVGVTFDISKWKEAEAQLLASEQLFRALVENSPDFIARYDREFRRIYVNPAIRRLFTSSTESVLGQTPTDQTPLYAPQVYIEHLRQAIETTTESTLETPFRTAQGEMHWGQIRFVPEFDADGKVASVLAIGRDVHEIKENEQRFRRLAENFPDFVVRSDRGGRIAYVNPTVERALGVPADAIVGKTLHELPHSADLERDNAILTLIQRTADEGVPNESEAHWEAEGGEHIFEIRHVPEKDAAGNVVSVLSIARDVTERKQMEETLRDSEERYRMVFENSPVSLWEEDFSEVKHLFDDLRKEGITDIEAYFDQHPETIQKCAKLVKIVDVNQAALTLHMAEKKEELFAGLVNAFNLDSYKTFQQELVCLWNGGTEMTSDAVVKTMTGDPRNVTLSFSVCPGHEQTLSKIIVSLVDITERMRAEEKMLRSDQRLRLHSELSPLGFLEWDENFHAVEWNAACERMFGYTREEAIGRHAKDLILPVEVQELVDEIYHSLMNQTGGQHSINKNVTKDGNIITCEWFNTTLIDKDGKAIGVASVCRDITERQQYEREREAVITVSTALRQARTRTEILNVILDQLVDLFDADGAVLVLPDPKTEGCINEMGSGVVGERMVGLSIPPEEGVCDWAIANNKTYLNNHADDDPLFYHSDLLGDSHCVVAAPLATQELIIGALWVARQEDFVEQDLRLLTAIADIAANAVHRVTLHEQTEQQLHRLIALHQIDLAISTSFDLNITLNVILGSVKEELEIDAASILLLNPVTHTLDYAAGIGFRTHNIERSRVRLGNGCAGRAAQEQRTVSSLELGQARENLSRFSFLSGEDFTSHYATPLVVKGQVKGVLEIFHRAAIEPEHTWLGYFETLATQAAIAIDNASLFENLQRSNMELTLAYDATIEGWSRALDLRDRETEGHTQRVTEMVLELAEEMGMSDAEKMDLRRGALLHDIGKMGIPDAILLKPGPLSDEEWKIMRQHPLYAYRMLVPITYLKRALEIPYCHHEKWDGSGYPRGLKGEEIPLSARMFAVVDVFDALISDRSYSKAWSHEQAYRYIQEQAGKHFDPQIAEIFLESE